LAAAGCSYLAAQITNTYVYNEITTLASPGADYYNLPPDQPQRQSHRLHEIQRPPATPTFQ
jgi:hypothetical protein